MILNSLLSALVFAGSTMFTPIALFVGAPWVGTYCDDVDSMGVAECDPWDTSGPGDYLYPDTTNTDTIEFFFQPTAARAIFYGVPHMIVEDERDWDCGMTTCEIDITDMTEITDEHLQLPELLCPSDTAGECPDGSGGPNAHPDDIIVCNCSNWTVGIECEMSCCNSGGGHCPCSGDCNTE